MIDIKSHIDARLSSISVSNELAKEIMNRTVYKNPGKAQRSFKHKWIITVAAVSLVLACSFTVFASAVPAVNDWLFRLNPQLAEFLYPINISDTDRGIKVEVLSAINDNHNAVVYFTVRDLTKQNRVDEKLDLCDTCDIDGPCFFNVQMLSFDQQTKTALFAMRGSGGEGLSNTMTSFKISRLMSGKTTYEWFDTGMNLAELAGKEAQSLPISKYDYSGGSELPKEGLDVLKPDVMSLPLGEGIDFAAVSNVGFVDGKLHIQTKWEPSFDNHGDFRLAEKTDADNVSEKGMDYDNYYFETEEDRGNCSKNKFARHIEFVFDVGSREALKNYRLWAYLVKDGTFTEGNWEVNFRMSDSDTLSIEGNGGTAESVEVTSIGAYLKGYDGDPESCNLSIVMQDGTELDYSRYASEASLDENKKENDIGMMFSMPINLEKIKSIALDGAMIYRGK